MEEALSRLVSLLLDLAGMCLTSEVRCWVLGASSGDDADCDWFTFAVVHDMRWTRYQVHLYIQSGEHVLCTRSGFRIVEADKNKDWRNP